MNSIDPITLGILWDRLISITDEIVSTLIRTSFSVNVRESYDLSCVLFDAQGRPLAQGTDSVPSFTGTAVLTMQHMLAKIPADRLRPGDVIATNDPWMGTGHLYDINVMRPVFRAGRLVGFTMSITHLPDIGGVGNSAVPREIYEEGLRLPVVRLVREGRLNEELVDIIRTNVRADEQVIGDLLANVSCNEVGGRLLLEFMDEYGVDDLTTLADAILDQSERTTRAAIATIPDGRYANRIQIEGVGAPVTLAVAVDKRGGDMAFDFTGTGPCIPAAINVPFCYTRAWTNYAVKVLTTPYLPNNDGSVRPIRLTAPADCILNAQPPFPTAGRHSVGHFVVPLIFGALAEAVPERIQADVGMLHVFNMFGTHAEGHRFASQFFLAGGYGAFQGLDGRAATPAPSNMGVVPTEVWENYSGMRIDRRDLLPDSGGAGRWRGGVGQETVLVNDTGHELAVAFMGQRTDFPARGLFGGGDGALREVLLNGEKVAAKGMFRLQPGDTVTLREAGGAGYGNPAERPPEAVLSDVLSGEVTAAAALRDYGVTVDIAAGTARRAG
jgi:N-methylhydantoinase B